MPSNTKEYFTVETYPSNTPEISRCLWMMQDTRSRTMETLKGVQQETLDWRPSAKENSIGTVLYHMADIEADWLYAEVLEESVPSDVMALFQHGTRDEHGHLSQAEGYRLDEHIKRLEVVRSLLLDVFQQMDLADFRRARSLPDYDVTPEWVLHHLMQHEAEHRGQIGSIISQISTQAAKINPQKYLDG